MKTVTRVLCAVLSCTPLFAQDPSSPAPPPPAAQTPKPPVDGYGRPIPSFLIIGTVFTEKDISFPGVRVRIRRTDQKKPLAETYTNTRGEFAVRVVPGYQYEVAAHVNKYQDQSKMVDSKVDVQQRLSIKLEPAVKGKAGGKS
jgi:hypothetical protein